MPWPPRPVPYPRTLRKSEETLVDAIAAHLLLEVSHVIECQATMQEAVSGGHVVIPMDNVERAQPLSLHVPYALVETLTQNDDYYTHLLRAVFPDFSWDQGNYGVTELDGCYYFMAPSGGIAKWRPVAQQLVCGVYEFPETLRPDARFQIPLETSLPYTAPPAPPTSANDMRNPTALAPEVRDALRVRHTDVSSRTVLYLMDCAASIADAGAGARGLHTCVPLPPESDTPQVPPVSRALAAILMLALSARVLVRPWVAPVASDGSLTAVEMYRRNRPGRGSAAQ